MVSNRKAISTVCFRILFSKAVLRNRPFQQTNLVFIRVVNIVQTNLWLTEGINCALSTSGRYVKFSLHGAGQSILKNVYPVVGRRVRGTEAYFICAKAAVYGMTDTNGIPSLFTSISLRYCPEFLCYANPIRFGSNLNSNCFVINAVSEDELSEQLNQSRWVAAMMFQC